MLDRPAQRPVDEQTADVGSTVRVAAVVFPRGGNVDAIFREVAERLQAFNVPVAGLLQEDVPGADPDCCPPMLVRDLAAGRHFTISEERGREARGCRLDWDALTRMAEQTNAALRSGARLLLVNRFGKAEAAGRGLRNSIELAIEAGIPVLVGVRDEYVGDWSNFHGGLAVDLPAECEAVLAWIMTACGIRET